MFSSYDILLLLLLSRMGKPQLRSVDVSRKRLRLNPEKTAAESILHIRSWMLHIVRFLREDCGFKLLFLTIYTGKTYHNEMK